MIRTLRRKFILTAMTAVSILLVVLIGAINVSNCLAEIGQAMQFLEILTGEDTVISPGGRKAFPQRLFDFQPGNGENGIPDGTYFTVRLDENGKVLHSDVSHAGGISGAEAEKYAAEALERGELSGRDGKFFYHIKESAAEDRREYQAAFVDFSDRLQTVLRILFLSAVIGAVCWMLMLLLVFFLAERAIRPIAENMEKQKQFVTDAGHEIKTPLAIILSNTDALELHSGESKWSRNIRAQTMRLTGLMQNLLTLAGTEEGGRKKSAAKLCLSDLLRETVQPFYEPACVKHLSFREDIDAGVMTEGNRDQLVRLFSALADNAVKYAEENGEAGVSLKRSDRSEIVIRFWNTCGTWPQGDPEKWFDRFYRGDSARTQKNGGYGIGLSVARAVTEAHGGTIGVKISRVQEREDMNALCLTDGRSGDGAHAALVVFTVRLRESSGR